MKLPNVTRPRVQKWLSNYRPRPTVKLLGVISGFIIASNHARRKCHCVFTPLRNIHTCRLLRACRLLHTCRLLRTYIVISLRVWAQRFFFLMQTQCSCCCSTDKWWCRLRNFAQFFASSILRWIWLMHNCMDDCMVKLLFTTLSYCVTMNYITFGRVP
jgi:hypothetical protein